MSTVLVLAVSLGYLALLFVVAYVGDRRAAQGHSLINSSWTYALSLGVYCTAWTYFGSVGRAASGGLWFLPIYLGPTMAMVLGWLVLRKIVRIAKAQRITSIADFIASRYGKSRLLAVSVTLIAIVGVVPYIALQLKGVSAAYGLLTSPGVVESTAQVPWSRDGTFYLALVLAGFTMIFGARHLDTTERHEGMVAAIAFESMVKLVAFLAVGMFVTYGLYNGFTDIFARAREQPELRDLLRLEQGTAFAWPQWFTMTVLAMLAVVMLPRQFQIMVVENVHESHLRRATWVFPAYLLAINVFVLPIALGGLLYFSGQETNPDNFVLSLPLAAGQQALALFVFVGGLSAATGMVIVESIAISIMVSNELVLPLLLRWRGKVLGEGMADLTRILLNIRRITILLLLLLGYVYFHVASEAYALVSIGLISFAAVAQFAPAALIGMYWRAGTRLGALGGLSAGFGIWVYTLMLPSIAKSGWLDDAFVRDGPAGLAWLKPEALFGLTGLDALTHSLFWSLLLNVSVYVALSLAREPSARETSQALIFVDAGRGTGGTTPVFWRGEARVEDLRQLCVRFFGAERAQLMFDEYVARWGADAAARADARFVSFVETKLAGAVGGASARVLVSSVAKEESLTTEDVLSMLEEASQLRAYSRALEEKSHSLEEATARLREANEQLKGLDVMKDEFMSSVTHELRTPLTSIRALAELMLDDPEMAAEQRQQFIGIVVGETERLSRLVNQVLDLAKIEAGSAEWHGQEVDMRALVLQAVEITRELFREQGCDIELALPAPHDPPALVHADPDRLQQVMLNLLSNAVKLVPRGAGRVRVELGIDKGMLTVSVTDNGPGISAEDQKAAFDKFRQIGDPRERRQGTGLGLPISRQIVEHYGGRIGVRSRLGHGATFHFTLPLLRPDARAGAAPGPEEQPT